MMLLMMLVVLLRMPELRVVRRIGGLFQAIPLLLLLQVHMRAHLRHVRTAGHTPAKAAAMCAAAVYSAAMFGSTSTSMCVAAMSMRSAAMCSAAMCSAAMCGGGAIVVSSLDASLQHRLEVQRAGAGGVPRCIHVRHAHGVSER
jgi:hypothetical protein